MNIITKTINNTTDLHMYLFNINHNNSLDFDYAFQFVTKQFTLL